MIKRLTLWLMMIGVSLLVACDKLPSPVQVRFDAVYFFQSEDVLKQKKVDLEQLAIFSRNLQSVVAASFKKGQVSPSKGYLVVAVRSDGEVAVWPDMEPDLHEYYDYEVREAVKKLKPFAVDQGIVVFGIKMAVESPVHTMKEIPEPKEFIEARKKLEDPDNIEQLVLSIWPQDE